MTTCSDKTALNIIKHPKLNVEKKQLLKLYQKKKKIHSKIEYRTF